MDLRYERTEQNLVDACLELGRKRPIRSLGVKEVSEKAKINRITFYSHYSNIDELADHIEDMAIQEWLEYVSPVTDYIHDTEAFILKSLEFTQKSRLGNCLMPGAHENYSNRAYEALSRRILEESGIKDRKMRNRLYFALHGSASLFYLNLIQDDGDIRDTAELIHLLLNAE